MLAIVLLNRYYYHYLHHHHHPCFTNGTQRREITFVQGHRYKKRWSPNLNQAFSASCWMTNENWITGPWKIGGWRSSWLLSSFHKGRTWALDLLTPVLNCRVTPFMEAWPRGFLSCWGLSWQNAFSIERVLFTSHFHTWDSEGAPALGRVSHSCPQSPVLALQMPKADGESQFGASGRAGGQVRLEASAGLTSFPPAP